MKRRRKNYLQLPVILLSLIGLIYLIFFINPSQSFSVLSFKISALPLFFILIFIFISNLFGFFLKNQRRGIFLGFLTVGIFLSVVWGFGASLFPSALVAGLSSE